LPKCNGLSDESDKRRILRYAINKIDMLFLLVTINGYDDSSHSRICVSALPKYGVMRTNTPNAYRFAVNKHANLDAC